MAGIDEWLSIARIADPDELRERILTGYRDGKPFTPYVPTVPLPSSLDRVLDFGCGLGRNFPYLRHVARHVAGFDLPPMIHRCRTLAVTSVDALYDDWSSVRSRNFDLVFATLVLQHVEPESCRSYLRDFARMAPLVYLLTRARSDFGENVLEGAIAADLFEVENCRLVEHDPGTHQLRDLGRRSIAEALRASGEDHYEVLLRARSPA